MSEYVLSKERDLDELETLTSRHRFDFRLDSAASDWILRQRPDGSGYAHQACDALLGRALLYFQHGDDANTSRCLSAARSIALDLADGSHIHHKGAALSIRRRTVVDQTSFPDSVSTKA